MNEQHRWFARSWMVMVYAFLYLPIFVLIAFSFNKGRPTHWNGFSTESYAALAKTPEILDGLIVSLKIAVISAIFSVIIGTLIAFVLQRYRRFTGKTLFSGMANTPLVMPEVVLGLSLLLVFKSLFKMEGGYLMIILGHTLLGAAYASVVIKARFSELPMAYEEAALDLGAKPLNAFFLVTLPLIAQSLISAGLLVFTISFDDVVVSQFLNGPGVKPLPNVILDNARQGAKPVLNALGAVIVFVVSVVLIAGSIWMQKREKKRNAEIAAAYRDAT
ncbi:Inner membrane ABC transporter permease protein YdcV [Ephemeroptericola cinctiostellae]|uniref:Inner membrane ABC transporter permease protein YdcV n=1 Tax=Ephemeroptericola cinctiostellae TaxID=2268024 RepID=A0A345D9M7_9BURK|nr:ABC transporter permease [Ephemeroptericola cinctiostellae]AXF85065.1 Inner membrane ABC transporter permease protein YdcV [Ephemeroptericola cinctiostellae]